MELPEEDFTELFGSAVATFSMESKHYYLGLVKSNALIIDVKYNSYADNHVPYVCN